MENSNIAWTDHTHNIWIGCTKVSEGCKFCYAEKWDQRMKGGKSWGPGAPRIPLSDAYWRKPLAWQKQALVSGERPRVFCSSLADVFDHEGLPDQRKRLWETVKQTPNLDWLILTKRPENIVPMLPSDWGNGYPNVWMGTTTEDQKSYEKRVPILAAVPAAVRFLSCEPQLSEIDFGSGPYPFDWVIFGGESGSVRPFDPTWVKKPFEVLREAGVAVFMKQMGSVWAKAHSTPDDKKGDNMGMWPAFSRVREFPKAR